LYSSFIIHHSSLTDFILKQIIITFGILIFILSCGEMKPVNPTVDDTDLSQITYSPTPITLKRPQGFTEMSIPADNLMTTEGIELGRRLFYDPILSRDSSMSCSSCHLPNGAFTDNKALSTGIDGKAGTRSAMSLENVGFVKSGLFWDGGTKTLEEQALLPVEDPIEMHHVWEKVEEILRGHKDYPTYFRKAFGIKNKTEITKMLAVKALAQFERSLISGNAKIDKILRKEEVFTDEEFNGFLLFFNDDPKKDAQCGHCHGAPFYGSNEFFNNGLDSVKTLNDFKDKGLGRITGKQFDMGKFRTPSLRNIEFTAPYMHDGRFKTLDEVMNHYASGGHLADNISPFIPLIKEIKMTARQKTEIIAFMKTLSDTSFMHNPSLQNPFKK
jgi:cytochrome c peroxidase